MSRERVETANDDMAEILPLSHSQRQDGNLSQLLFSYLGIYFEVYSIRVVEELALHFPALALKEIPS